MPSHVRFDPVSLATEPAPWAAAGIVIGLYLFFRGFGLLPRNLLIQSVPSSTVPATHSEWWNDQVQRPSALQRNFPALGDRVLLLPCHPAASSGLPRNALGSTMARAS